MSASASSVSAVLGERARQWPDECAYTFVDYDVDPAGSFESLTWSQVHTRARAVAAELASCASPGDRVAILAPQGLEYIVGFLGALEGGFVAVPLSVPMFGTHDARVSAALTECSPAAVLTTSAVVDGVLSCVHALSGSAPTVIEVDALDLDTPPARPAATPQTKTAYLQYTSGSTRQPAGVVISQSNIVANFEQIMGDYFCEYGKVILPGTTVVSWLPFYHDMGLVVGIILPIMAGMPCVVTSPVAFLQRPARWMQLMASNGRAFSAAPNFAFDLAARKTSDDDMAGFDLGNVLVILNGSERVQPPTLRRFSERFTHFNLPDAALRPAYGMAEAVVYLKSRTPAQPPKILHFDPEKLTAGRAERCADGDGTPLVSYGDPVSPLMRIVDPDTSIECPAGTVGEIWVHGRNVAMGYLRNPELSKHTFGGRLVNPAPDTPQGPWLRTGDLGFFCDGEMYIIGRIKDVLIVDGRNHYPDDIEATIQEITRSRAAAICVPNDRSEQLVAIVELKKRGGSDDEESRHRFHTVKRELTSAIAKSHGLRVADLVLVPPGSLPITTSGKVRRSACVERYRQDEFTRLDTHA